MSSEAEDKQPEAPVPPPADGGETNPGIILTGNLDYEVIFPAIGRGSYGEVYLARTKAGGYCAVKVVYRVSFEDDRPYEREYAGILKFEPISRLSANQLQILRVGRRDQAGYFYYIMEVADDVSGGRDIKPDTYIPRTLKSEIQMRGGRIPARECCEIGLALAVALENLHEHRLVHRDIKPANIIFVQGSPKLADLGLVTDSDKTMTCVGTEGYIPPEGPGSPRADIFALGMVLYEAFTGGRHRDFPRLPENMEDWPDHALLLKLNRIVSKACEANLRRRYQNASDLRRDLEQLSNQPQIQAQPMVKNNVWLAVGAAAVILLGMAWILWGHNPASRDANEPSEITAATGQANSSAPFSGQSQTMSKPGGPSPQNALPPEAMLQTLIANNIPGQRPLNKIGRMVAGPDNSFYAWAGARQVIKLTLDGKQTLFARFYVKDGNVDLASNPRDNSLYGTTAGSPRTGFFGRLFRLNAFGEVVTITNFSGQQPPRPREIMFNTNDNNFYGIFLSRKKSGSIIQMDLAGNTKIIASFNGANGNLPAPGPLLIGAYGYIY